MDLYTHMYEHRMLLNSDLVYRQIICNFPLFLPNMIKLL